MKMHKSYALLSLVTAIAVAGMSLGAVSFAQTVPVACSIASSSVNTNQAAVFTATGGNGVYVWSGPNLNVTIASTGLKSVAVSSAGLSAVCAVNVLAGTPTPPVTPGLPDTGGGYGK